VPSVPSVPEVPQTTSTSTLPPPPSNAIDEHSNSNGVYISPNSHPERTSSFFAQPGILAGNIKITILIVVNYCNHKIFLNFKH